MHRKFNHRMESMRVDRLNSSPLSECRQVVAIRASAHLKHSMAMRRVKFCSERHYFSAFNTEARGDDVVYGGAGNDWLLVPPQQRGQAMPSHFIAACWLHDTCGLIAASDANGKERGNHAWA